MKRIFSCFGKILLYLLPCVLLCEVIGTVLVKREIKKHGQIEKLFRVKSEIYHHALNPSVPLQKTYWGPVPYQMATNSLTFRDEQARDVPLASPQHRVLFIGDSLTEGVGVDYADTFAGLAASRWKSQGVEVLNAGVVSYSPIIYYRKLKHFIEERGLKVDEVVVFIDLSDAQDEVFYRFDSNENVVDDDSELARREKETGYDHKRSFGEHIARFFDKRTFYLSYLFFEAKPLFYGSEAQYAVNQRRAVWTVDKQVFDAYAAKGLQNGALHMDMLRALLEKRGIKLTIAVYPWPDQIYYWDTHSIQSVFWKQWAEQRKVAFVDLFPYFFRTDGSMKSRLETIKKYYIPRDYHWNKWGHRLVADGLFEQYAPARAPLPKY